MRPEAALGTAGPRTAVPDAGVSDADARVPDGEAMAAGEVVSEDLTRKAECPVLVVP